MARGVQEASGYCPSRRGVVALQRGEPRVEAARSLELGMGALLDDAALVVDDEAVHELEAVGEAGEGVVEGLAAEGLLQRVAVAEDDRVARLSPAVGGLGGKWERGRPAGDQRPDPARARGDDFHGLVISRSYVDV